ncbi:hypothetical protein GCM10025734_58860 [Kitasatospora paranensis]
MRIAVADITGTTLAEQQVATKGWPAAATVEKVAAAVAATVRQAGLAEDSLREVVIGVPGALDPSSGKLRYASHLPGWHSPRLVAELEEALGAPVAIENDVNLAAIAEQAFGAAAGCEDFVLLWAEEGIGAAIVIAGRLHRGFTGGAGEVGYMPVPGAPVVHDVRRRNSGGFQELAGADAVLALAAGHGLAAPTAEQAVQLALTTPGAGDDFLAVLAERFATGLAVIVSVVDPELLVLSGGIPAAGGERLRELVQEALASISIPRPEVRFTTVPGSPVLHGALQRALAAAREAAFTTH